ncbi:hypothetical protein SBA3_250029 [Candidatus Sulfopaludibacter sp. SbA3]|nr:hypothetical protein SBA3_250029 [Candidatus Sulfopaludibacter sp. SbA3]
MRYRGCADEVCGSACGRSSPIEFGIRGFYLQLNVRISQRWTPHQFSFRAFASGLTPMRPMWGRFETAVASREVAGADVTGTARDKSSLPLQVAIPATRARIELETEFKLWIEKRASRS